MRNKDENNGTQCTVCKKNIEDGLFKTALLIPTSEGGRNTPSNRMICCIDCSLSLTKEPIAARVPGFLISELKIWKEEHLPTSTLSSAICYCIKRTLSEGGSDFVKLSEDMLTKNRILIETVKKQNHHDQLVDDLIELVKLYEKQKDASE